MNHNSPHLDAPFPPDTVNSKKQEAYNIARRIDKAMEDPNIRFEALEDSVKQLEQMIYDIQLQLEVLICSE